MRGHVGRCATEGCRRRLGNALFGTPNTGLPRLGLFQRAHQIGMHPHGVCVSGDGAPGAPAEEHRDRVASFQCADDLVISAGPGAKPNAVADDVELCACQLRDGWLAVRCSRGVNSRGGTAVENRNRDDDDGGTKEAGGDVGNSFGGVVTGRATMIEAAPTRPTRQVAALC